MKKQSLNDHLVTYYRQKKVSPQFRDDLLELIEGADSHVSTAPVVEHSFLQNILSYLSPGRFAYASIFLLLGYVAWMVHGLASPQSYQAEYAESISREIAMNHSKQFSVEFEDSTVSGLTRLMDKLDFPLSLPEELAGSMKISGARYCSIKGRIAAQIQMVDSEGNYCTLYQTKLVEPLRKIKNSTMNLDGVKLLLWQEKGVFFGLAEPLK